MEQFKTLCTVAAVAFTMGGIALSAAPASAKRPIIISAQLDPDQHRTRVGYADLNLASASGKQTLMRRVSGAVYQVCDQPLAGELGLESRSEVSSCRSFAWRGARPQVDLAVERAQQIARTGSSSIAAAAITISVP